MNQIQDENKYFNQQLHEKYLRNNSFERVLTKEEKEWLIDHGTIRVGYQDNYLAFCSKDKETGELTGALKDYLARKHGILIRDASNFRGLTSRHFRIAAQTPAENDALVSAIKELVNSFQMK
jgi:histidinol-phosphate/aromatic aminotransferase/cobyric acid decarboxylase-like protein